MRLIGSVAVVFLTVAILGCGGEKKKTAFRYFRNYQRTFNDMNDRHLKAARQWGIKPIMTDADFEREKGKLSEISSGRYYEVDKLTYSVPFLVPRAESLLEKTSGIPWIKKAWTIAGLLLPVYCVLPVP